MHRKNVNTNSGFTLAETLIAISILAIAIAAPLALGQQSLKAIRFTQGEVTAQYLAQDVMEYLRGYRDTQASLEAAFLGTLNTDCAEGFRVCTFDTTLAGNPSSNMQQFTSHAQAQSSAPLRFNAANGKYGYTPGWEETTYTRTVYFMPPDGGLAVAGEYATVVVTVTWVEKNDEKTYQLSQTLYNLP